LPKVNTKKVTWDEVDEWCKLVSDKIYGSGWRPEVIIAISRGGYVPGRLVCDRLVVGDLVSLQISHWPSAAQMAKEAAVKYPLDYDLNHKRVLIMDDITDTGDSIIVAKDYIWTKCKPDEIKVATLQWISSSSKIKPDFFAEEVKGWIWYQYPWTRLEDIIGFIKRIIIEEKGIAEWTMEDLKKMFVEWYGVTFDEWFYARSLDYLVSKSTLMKGEKGYRLASR
jgi:hypoxanthine phosphoribosyltransferase